MGRKRTSNKERILISVDKDVLQELRDKEINRSQLFMEKAEEILSEEEKRPEKV